MITAVVADDQAMVRGGLRIILEQADIQVVAECADGTGAVAAALRYKPDIVLMDVRMPGVDGIEATSRIVAADGPPVLVITTYDFDEVIVGALRAGAAGFLLKSAEPEQVVAAVHTVLDGESIVSPAVTGRLIRQFVRQAPDLGLDARLDELTAREHEVWLAVARGLSNQEVADALVIEQSTVKRHLRSVMIKTGTTSRAQLIVLAFRSGRIAVGDL